MMINSKKPRQFGKVNKFLSGFFLFSLLFVPIIKVFAQSSGKVNIYSPQISEFPSVHFVMEAYDDYGNFVFEVNPENIQIIEDGYQLPALYSALSEPGLQTILAINETPMMTYQYAGISYYEHLRSGLVTWLESRAENGSDIYSLVTNPGPQAVRLSSAGEFSQTLLEYDPDFLHKQAGTTSLSYALDLATDALPDPHMKKVILYVTPLPSEEMIDALPELANRAAQLGVHVLVWLVSPTSASTYYTEPLLQLAEQTDGRFFVYTGGEDFPDLDALLKSWRYVYQVAYQSRIHESGEHQISIYLNTDVFQANSNQLSFNINISPANPIFLDPPTQILRVQPEKQETGISPSEVPVKFLIEFPDGYERAITATRFFVNDELIGENYSEPFSEFTWSLMPYTESQDVNLRVEVEDSLGLKQSSITTQVNIIVEEPEQPWWHNLVSTYGLLIMFSLITAGGVLGLVLIISGRRRLRSAMAEKRKQDDPLTQPVVIRENPQNKKSPLSDTLSRTIPVRRNKKNLQAVLIKQSENGQSTTNQAILINHNNFTIGSNPDLTGKTVEGSLAKQKAQVLITREPGDKFFLTELDLQAGILVNYSPVPATGIKLNDGDVIHFGGSAYQFRISGLNNDEHFE